MTRVAHWLSPWKPGGASWKHYRLGFIVLFLAAVLFQVAVTVTTVKVVQHLEHGGYRPEPLPASQRINGGPVPSHYSLNRFIVRLHDQGASNSCVAQTISEIVEVDRAEGGIRQPYSPEYIWGQLNGCWNQGLTYAQGFGLLSGQGDAPESVMAGLDPKYYYGCFSPSGMQAAAARAQIFSSWQTISVADRYSIEAAISSGNPVAFAAPWLTNWVQHFNTTAPLPFPGGYLNFWHSVMLYAYDSNGVWMLQSWPGWGDNQRALIPWDVLAASGGSMVVAYPSFSRTPIPPPAPPKKRHFPIHKWQSWAKGHHKPLPAWRYHHKTLLTAWRWWRDKGLMKRWGYPKQTEHWLSKQRVMKQVFTRGTLYTWSRKPREPWRFVR